jgi:Tol biopolymer transport system component
MAMRMMEWLLGVLGVLIGGTVLLAEPQRLTTDGRFKDAPAFVDPAGRELAFVVQETPQLMRAMRLNLADGAVTALNPEWHKNEFEPAFSRDGLSLASVQSRGNLSMAIVVRGFPQGPEFELPPEGGFCGFRSPTFTPDGKQVYYSFADRDRQSIMAVNRQGGDKRTIIDGPGHANWPSFSADGMQFVFGSTRHGNYEIYAAKPDGSDVRRLTDHPRQDIRPRFSPDGKRIVFTSGRDGNYEIYVMQADGGHPRRLTDNPERDDYACWHPDSRRIVYVSERSGRHDLYMLDAGD